MRSCVLACSLLIVSTAIAQEELPSQATSGGISADSNVNPELPAEMPAAQATEAAAMGTQEQKNLPGRQEPDPLPTLIPDGLPFPSRPPVYPAVQPSSHEAPARSTAEADSLQNSGAESAQSDGVLKTSPFQSASKPTLYRTGFEQVVTTGDLLVGGLGGIPGTLQSPVIAALNPPRPLTPGFRIGPVNLRPTIGTGISASHLSGDLQGGRLGNVRGVESPGGVQRRNFSRAGGSNVFGFINAGVDAILGEPDFGRIIALQYDAVLAFPSDGDQTNGFDQSLSVRAQYRFARLDLGLGVSFADISGVDRDFGGAVSRDLFTTSFTAAYPLREKTSVSLEVAVPVRRFSEGISSGGVTSTVAIDYTYSPKLMLGVGTSFGFLAVEDGASQTFEQLTLRVGYQPSEKLSFTARGGAELRCLEEGTTVSPVLGFGATWQPRVSTQVSLISDISVVNSALEADTNYLSSSVQLSLSQRVGSRVSAGLALGYEYATYQSAGAEGDRGRNDHLVTASASVGTIFANSITVSFSLAAGHNWSNTASFEFVQATLQASTSF